MSQATLYLGLMSGTSIDSIDAAAVSFDQGQLKLLGTYTHPISDALRLNILNLSQPGLDSVFNFTVKPTICSDICLPMQRWLSWRPCQLDLTILWPLAATARRFGTRHPKPTALPLANKLAMPILLLPALVAVSCPTFGAKMLH